ncbi:RNA-binding CRS1 / YhbY (CRM) domain protein [Striga hermonthica]|uniref:RNA-binding CRS1 / YhbY (CRM) domain protein n=1 Tax=Striga hermonthica TaxID=68872 RepID=A0A9N7MLN5_STRHE|nr:RNA-binding CRS1 / YhbY (CRM) domain protein [Striga hermonthica]
MANPVRRTLCRLSCLLNRHLSFSKILQQPQPSYTLARPTYQLQDPQNCFCASIGRLRRSFSHGSVSLVISPLGSPKFETHEIDPPKKEKWKRKKRLKVQRKREKQKRKAANKRDPRRLGVKGKNRRQKFANAEERIKYKLDNVCIYFLTESNLLMKALIHLYV